MLNDQLLEHYVLHDSIKKYKGYKVKSPEETVGIIESYFAKIGLKIDYRPWTNTFLRTFSSFQSGSAVLHPDGKNTVKLLESNGKGVTPRLSQASACAELIERFAGYGLAFGLSKHYLTKIKVRDIWEKKAERNEVLGDLFPFHSVDTSELILDDRKQCYHSLAKSVCYSLTRKKLFLYPEEFMVKIAGSNGLASGNTNEEAMLHGLFECIERLSGLYLLDLVPKCKRISVDSFTHPTLKKIISRVQDEGVTFEILDFSFLFNVPVIITIFDHEDWDLPTFRYTNNLKQYPSTFIGVDSNAEDAALRCFTEFLQGLFPIYDDKKFENQIRHQFSVANLEMPFEVQEGLKSPFVCFKNGNQPVSVDLRKYLKLKRESISVKDIVDLYDVNNRVEIERLIRILKKSKMEVLVQDITNPVVPFPVFAVMLSGGSGYFSKVPLNGYDHLVLGVNDRASRYALLDHKIKKILSPSVLLDVLQRGEWCRDVRQDELIDLVITDVFGNGNDNFLWGVHVNKFYFLSLLYIRLKRYREAMNCIDAALIDYLDDLPSILAKAFISLKTDRKDEYEKLMDYAEIINKDNIDLHKELKKFEDPVISPNPFDTIKDADSVDTRPELFEYYFFNYVDENVFMKTFLDELLDK